MKSSIAAAALTLGVLAGAHGVAFAQTYCIDPLTKRVVSSPVNCRPGLVPSPAEVTAAIEAARADAIAADIHQGAVRADLQRLRKSPDDRSHRKAELAELEVVAVSLRGATQRLAALMAQSKPLYDEVQFYVGKPLPPALQSSVDASNASMLAMVDVFRGLQQDVEHVVGKYKVEREWLRHLWGGAAPGSMGLLVEAPTPAPPR